MPRASLMEIVRYCDRTLRTAEVNDYDGAVNGLQVENDGFVRRIAAAVDGTAATAQLAREHEADLLLVHHGLFWSPAHPWTGKKYELFRLLLQSNLAVYSSHLPLDVHPTLGNNVQLCRSLGLKNLRPFFFKKGEHLGFQSKTRIRRAELAKRLAAVTGNQPSILPGGPEWCERIGVVTGGAGSELKLAAEERVDTFITGEGPHWTFALSEELGVNVFYGGHYATETFGVKALAASLSKRFKVPWVFLDHPTGL
ncbi:MAG TPA: Nif3-like dinuclear metal center hexameric protein [Candidatus Saccharimonadales bacterium]|nr:Nif3-like dinuclear metal center hexameric protein [Candidatus Saccharimonadales bacterium]